MEANDNVELIQIAIQQLIEDKKNKKKDRGAIISSSDPISIADADDDDDLLLLSRLLSQLDSVKGEGIRQKHDELLLLSGGEMEVNLPGVVGGEVNNNNNNKEEKKKKREVVGEGDDITKELGKIQKQNLITQCLLSVLIVLTFAWQLSEVSLILKVKDGLKNPFKSLGSMFTGILKGHADRISQNENKDSSSSSSSSSAKNESPSIPLLIPELPHLDLIPGLGLNGNEH